MSATTASVAPPPAEPHVRGESEYDRVTSLLMAVVLGALLLFAGLALVYATSQAYAARVAAPIEVIEVAGLAGGVEEGRLDETRTTEIPEAAAAEAPSNNVADASEFEEPQVLDTPPTLLDPNADVGTLLADLAPAAEGTSVATGRRASRIGSGAEGYGFGGGDGSLPREQRWSILFNPGQTAEEYARQLDFLGIELATVRGPDTLVYASSLSSPQPRVRTGSSQADRRLYFAWQGRGRKESDVELLRKAGIEVGDKPILQFCSPAVEEALAQLEIAYRGRKPSEIRVTRFRVVPRGSGYAFEVIDQQTLR